MRGVERLKDAVDSETGRHLLKSRAVKGAIGVLLAISAIDASSALLNFSNEEYGDALNSALHHESTFLPALGLLALRKRAHEIENATQIQPETEYVLGL